MKKHNQNQDMPAVDPEFAELEERVDALLDPSRTDNPDQGIDTSSTNGDAAGAMDASTAPELPNAPIPKEPLKITVVDHTDTAEPNEASDERDQQLGEQEASGVEPPGAPVVDEAQMVAESHDLSDELPDKTVESTELIDGQDDKPEPAEILTDSTEAVTSTHADETSIVDDASTSRAVDAILAEESDKLLAADDFAAAAAVKPKKSPGRLRQFFRGWRKNPLTKWLTIGFVVAVLVAGAVLPASRYYVLNNAGVRSKASLVVLDQSTQQPLKNARVTLGESTAQTNDSGEAFFENLPLGPTSMAIEKRAFSAIYQGVTIGWGSNPLGSYSLEPTGSQYVFRVTDFLSGKPITDATAESEYANANADQDGKLLLTLDEADDVDVEVLISAPGFRSERVVLDLAARNQNDVVLVNDGRHAFITKRTGKYDLYAVDVDGKNEKLVVAGTGAEQDSITIEQHPSAPVVAFVSTRENQRNADGYLLSSLYIVNLNSNDMVRVTTSEQIQIIGWAGDRLAYVQIAAGASAANPHRQRLMSFDYKQHDNKQVASANYFNVVLAVNDTLYYAGSNGSAYDAGGHFVRMNFDGSNQQTILPSQTWSALRTGHDTLVLNLPGKWYEYSIGGNTAKELPGQPADANPRTYYDSPNGKRSIWFERRDGKGTLIVRDVEAQTESTLVVGDGVGAPVRWLDDTTVIYRVDSGRETADYVLSLDGGEARKIVDVTQTGGTDRWYYY